MNVVRHSFFITVCLFSLLEKVRFFIHNAIRDFILSYQQDTCFAHLLII